MISQTKKLQQRRVKSQAGVTLLLSILILSSIMAISFSLATVLFVEIRSSTDVLRSEPAFYAAASITEQGIFNVKRGVSESGTTWPTSIGNVQISNPVLNPLAPPVLQVLISPYSAGVVSSSQYQYYYTNTPNRYLLGSLSNSNCNSTQIPCGGYGALKITNLRGSATDPLIVFLCEYDPGNANDDCDHTTSANFVDGISGVQISPGDSPHMWQLNPNKQYELHLINSNINKQTLNVQIETFEDISALVRKGMPYFGQKSVEVNASNSGVTRSLRTIVPTQ